MKQPTLRKEADRFPQWFRNLVSRLARISQKLRREREPSMYGDEESGVPPDELYDEEDAREALANATEVF
uniref:HEPN domain-containing protein n=1 Tax=Ignisphaera aggregans TaxID=334771 RepID=A0A7J2U5W9_9CREN